MEFHLLRILEIKHVSRDNKVLWEAKHLSNMFHTSGEEYCLRALFLGGATNTYIPTNYYFGLDNRSTVAIGDTMETIIDSGGEPASNTGYFRQAVASQNQFQMTLGPDGHMIASSPIISFVANSSGSGWGPVSNLFLTNKVDNTGYLISSVPLNQSLQVAAGEGVHMRMSLTLGYCPDMPSVS